MSTVRGSELLGAPAGRRKVRKCQDCTEPNPATAGHTDPAFCPACIGAHSTRCTACTAAFTRDGVHTLCPSCRDQLPLFAPATGAQA